MVRSVQVCVFDEADRLFEMGFAFQLREIMKKLPESRQTCLFSATLPAVLVEFTRAGLTDPIVVRLDVENKISDKLGITFFSVRKEQKVAALVYILRTLIPEEQQTIVFAATRHHVEFLNGLLQACGICSTAIYGQLNATARKINMAKFRVKKAKVLVVTDLAARGIDIPLLENVINFDFADKPKLFVHRAGRVARAGREGNAYSLIAPDEIPYMLDLLLFLGGRKLETSAEAEAFSMTNPDYVHFGTFPNRTIEDEMESTQATVLSAQLTDLERVMNSAYKMYYRTRQPASQSSATRARSLPRLSIHPLLVEDGANQQDSNRTTQESVDDFLDAIRGYQPSTTIMEVDKQQNAAMAQKRAAHDLLIKKRQQQEAYEARLKQQNLGGVTRAEGEGDEINGNIDDQQSSLDEAVLDEDNSDSRESNVSSKKPAKKRRKTMAKKNINTTPSEKLEPKQFKPRKARRSKNKSTASSESDDTAFHSKKRSKTDFKDPNFFISTEYSGPTDEVQEDREILQRHTAENRMCMCRSPTHDSRVRAFVAQHIFTEQDPPCMFNNENYVPARTSFTESWIRPTISSA